MDRVLEANKEKPLAGIVAGLAFQPGRRISTKPSFGRLFIETGPVVGERDGQNIIDWKYDKDPFALSQPLVILTDSSRPARLKSWAGSAEGITSVQ